VKNIIFLLICLPICAAGQNLTDSIPDKIWNVELSASYDLALADMDTRFGNSFRLGAGISHKSRKNLIVGGQFLFILGGAVQEEGLLSNMSTSQNGIISQFGDVLKVEVYQRGYMCGLHFGKIFPVNKKNVNSGFTAISGAGFIQHKINIFDRDNVFPQLRDELVKGYDRLTNGLYLKQFLGYTYYAPNKLWNFRAGIDFVYGLTEGRRNWLYDVEQVGNEKRNDLLNGFSFTWNIPLYQKIVEETYY